MAYNIEIKNFKEGTLQFTFYQSGETEKKSLDAGELLKFVHNQQMYKPGSLEVELYITKADVTINALNGQLVTLYEGSTIIAKEYFIFNVRKKGSYVTLKAYSADYFLTLDKFCQAFTAKTLVEGIINPTFAKCSTKNFDNFRKIAGTSAQGALAHFLNGELLPYAVQYNESFYDFIVRMCNRNGEFLYLDANNKLHVGLSGNIASLPTTIEEGNVEYVNSYVETEESSWVDRNYLEGSGCKSSKAEKDKIKCYKAYGVYAPEFLEKIAKEEYCNWEDYTCFFTEFSAVLQSFANERTAYDASLSFLKTVTCNNSLYGYWVNTKNKIFKNTYPKDNYLYSTDITKEKSNINEIYLEIDNYQRQAQANQVRLFFSETPSVKLGDQVTYNGTEYVVYEVHNNTYKNNSTYTSEYELLLVGKTTGGFYPLPMPEVRIKKASAQRAIVVDNFDPDRLGRVRVMYPWQAKSSDEDYLKEIKSENKEEFKDKDKEKEIKENYRNDIRNRSNSSPWIRVSVPMASDGAGFLFTPAVDDEVLIDYEDGNIERPYVCGAFYNENNKPSIPAQAHNYDKVSSITSANGHHISFTDNGGAERFFFNDVPIVKMANAFGVHDNIIPGDKFFGGGFEISDYYGVYAIKGSTHGRSVDISSPFGTISIDALTGISINAPLGDVKIVGKNVSIEARNNLTIESGTNVKGYLDGTNKENWKNKLWENLGETALGGIVDISNYRHLLEIFLRPIGGTMLLKSNRYMRLEAGEGETIIDDSVDYNEDSFSRFCSSLINYPFDSVQTINIVKERMYNAFAKYKQVKDLIVKTIALAKEVNGEEGKTIVQSIITQEGVLKKEDLVKLNPFDDLQAETKERIKKIRKSIERINNEISKIKNDKDLKGQMKNEFTTLWDRFKSQMGNITSNTMEYTNIRKRQLMLSEFKEVFKNSGNNRINISDNTTDQGNLTLKQLKESITTKDLSSKPREISAKVLGFEKFLDDKTWTSRDTGAILFSDNKDNYYKIGKEGSIVRCEKSNEIDLIVNIIHSVGDDTL